MREFTMSKRKYESFTDEQARTVLWNSGSSWLCSGIDPKGKLDRSVRNPSPWKPRSNLRRLLEGIGGRVQGFRIDCTFALIDAIREGYFEAPAYTPFDRERCIKEVKAVTPCCDDVTKIILEYHLPFQYAPGTVLRTQHVCCLGPQELLVQHYTSMGKCRVYNAAGQRCHYLIPVGTGFRYNGNYYMPLE